MGKKSVSIALMLVAIACLPAHAVEGDENWSSAFALPGADAEVYATLEFDGDLIAGGAFHHIALCAADRIARWDGSDWSPMGAGFDGDVHALIEFEGELYAGGSFRHSGAVTVNAVARWDGSAWQPLAEQLGYHRILSFCVHEGELVAGGIADWDSAFEEYFEIAGLAAWDGAQWTEIADFDWDLNCRVRDLEIYEGDLIAGGNFEGIDGDWSSSYVARWDGVAWTGMATPEEVHALLLFDAELYAGGNGGLRRWTGVDWATMGSGLSGSIMGLTTYSNGIAACGSIEVGAGYGAAFWDGAIWTPIGEPFANPGLMSAPYLYTIDVFGDLLVAGGSFRQAGRNAIPRLAAWDSAAWGPIADLSDTSQFNGLDSAPYALGSYGDEIVAGGSFDYSYNLPLNGIGLWDGAAWQSMGAGLLGSGEYAYAIEEYAGDLVVGGEFVAIDGLDSPNLATWTGTGWQAFGAGRPYTCRKLLADGANLYVAGDGGLGDFDHYIDLWDGEAWSDLGPNLRGSAYDMLLFEDDLVVIGSFSEDETGQPLNRVARWDGQAWQGMGAGFSSYPRALLNWGGTLVVGGHFSDGSGESADYLAHWDGLAWQAFSAAPNGPVWAMAVFHGDLVIGGQFTEVNGLPVGGLARWNGDTWSAFGSGPSLPDHYGSMVYDLLAKGDRLYASGLFRNAGGKASFGMACWLEDLTGTENIPAPGGVLATAAWPNPFNPTTEIQFALPQDSPTTLRIVDSSGRELRRLLDGSVFTAGTHRLSWDGRDDAGRLLSSGVYFYEVRAGEHRATQKLTLLK